MSSIPNDEDGVPISVLQDSDADLRVVETKHEFPEDYECHSCVKKEKKCMKPPKLDETVSRPIPSNKLNETLRNKKCSHCGQSVGECLCLSDEVRKQLTKLHENKQDENKKEGGENTKNPK